ncbi:MAG: CrcB family protein [Actinomyces sp.]|uniref:fluoride efflux transporter FluC n=1 Tax=Actinomyces sp. TaxID=29317 RepID=UPI0026DAD33B|nr:CrcB family protein [Actinomyces sp.]MDO4242729.1 CrcB family protein [Actinomyces sp.]
MTWALVAVAGGLGAIARFTVDSRVSAALASRGGAEGQRGHRGHRARPPLGTIVVNLSACLALGILVGAAVAPAWLQVTVGTGFLGGYSTFSTACLEGARLWLDGRGAAALVHGLAMTAGTLAAAALGVLLGAMGAAAL